MEKPQDIGKQVAVEIVGFSGKIGADESQVEPASQRSHCNNSLRCMWFIPLYFQDIDPFDYFLFPEWDK